jgi:hypothetical protein
MQPWPSPPILTAFVNAFIISTHYWVLMGCSLDLDPFLVKLTVVCIRSCRGPPGRALLWLTIQPWWVVTFSLFARLVGRSRPPPRSWSRTHRDLGQGRGLYEHTVLYLTLALTLILSHSMTDPESGWFRLPYYFLQ